MNKALYILTTIILMFASFIIGSRIGAESFLYSDAKFQAALAAADLIRLDKNDIEGVRSSLEFELDRNLLFHGNSEKSIFRYLWPELQLENKKIALHAITAAATYKKNHYQPFVSDDDLKTFPANDRDSLKSDSALIDTVMKKYAQ